eukprot:75252_1
MAAQRRKHRVKRTKSEDIRDTYNALKLSKLSHAKTVESRRRKNRKKRTVSDIPHLVPRAQTAPKKLGPRDIGRIKYQGTKYVDNDQNRSFLEEKINRHSRSSSFAERKSKNPLQKRKRIEEIGSPYGWHKPSFYNEEVEAMRRIQVDQWLKERPLMPPDNALDALKSMKAPKRGTVAEVGTKPKGWESIPYKYDAECGTFLNEKLWFEGSRAPIINGLSQMIMALPPERQTELKALPSPTGIHSKINFVKKLRDIVLEQVRTIHREEKLLKKYQSKRTLNVIDNFESKYQTLLKRTNSSLGRSRREIFTMKSVRALDTLIFDMEHKRNLI